MFFFYCFGFFFGWLCKSGDSGMILYYYDFHVYFKIKMIVVDSFWFLQIIDLVMLSKATPK